MHGSNNVEREMEREMERERLIERGGKAGQRLKIIRTFKLLEDGLNFILDASTASLIVSTGIAMLIGMYFTNVW
jgi:hypothetical protein